jgi:cell division protein FtsB
MAKTRKSTRTGVGGNSELLTWALHGLEQEIATTRQRLQDLEAQARQLRSGTRGAARAAAADDTASAATGTGKVRKKRKLSADARRRIAEAQKRRWAKAKAGKE